MGRGVVRVRDHDGLSRSGTAAVLGVSLLVPLLGVYRVAVLSPQYALLTVVVTAAVLPVQTWLVLVVIRGRTSPRHRWALAALTTAVLVLVPIIGVDWLNLLYPASALVLLVVPRPLSIALFVGLMAASGLLAVPLDDPGWVAYYALGTFMVGTGVAVPVWLAAAARQLRAAQSALADDRVIQERLRITDDLRAVLSPALERLAAQGERAGDRATTDAAGTTDDVRELVRDARAILADVRRLSARYQRASLPTELHTAVTLLAASGIEADLQLPPNASAHALDDEQRSALRDRVLRLLSDDTSRSARYVVSYVDGQPRIGKDDEPLTSAGQAA